jgi:hypothetical protein
MKSSVLPKALQISQSEVATIASERSVNIKLAMT